MPLRALLASTVVVISLLLPAPPAGAAVEATSSAAAERALVELVNAHRADQGTPALTPRSDLYEVARRWSFRQAERGAMAHNRALGDQVCCWTRIGENVAKASGHADSSPSTLARVVFELWRTSPSHAEQMLDDGVDQLGVGIVVDDDGTLWATADFRQCDGTACAGGAQGNAGDDTRAWGAPPPAAPAPDPAPSPAPEPEPAPAPEPEPEPAPEPDTEPAAEPSPEPAAEPSPEPEPTAPPADQPDPTPTPSDPPPVPLDATTRSRLATAARAPQAPAPSPWPAVLFVGLVGLVAVGLIVRWERD